MTQFLSLLALAMPAIIMFAATVLVCALWAWPARRWQPTDGTVRFYWRGVWMFLVAITSVAGAMNTLSLLGMDAVEPTEWALRVLLAGFVLFVVVGWFQLVGLALLRGAARLSRRTA